MERGIFDDLLDIRTGGKRLTFGRCPTRVEPLTDPRQWKVKAQALRDIFRQTLGHTPDISCPLALKIDRQEQHTGYTLRTISYNVEPDERISAYVLIPDGLKRRAPAVLCLHPTTPLGKEQSIGNDTTSGGADRAYALHLVARGYVTLAFDQLSAGQRRFRLRRAFDTAPFYKKHPDWSVRGKDIWDVGRAVDVLESMDEVDRRRIGSIGHSQGGGLTIHSMALDERIVAGVSNCGLWPQRLSKNPFNYARTEWWVGQPALRPYCYAGKAFPIDMHELLALAAPRAIFNITALDDHNYGYEDTELAELRGGFENMVENVAKVFALLGVPEKFKAELHAKGHGFEQDEREKAYGFLDTHLKM